MAFPVGSFDKSVFGLNSYKGAIGSSSKNGYAVVKITPKYARPGSEKIDPSIKGVLDTSSGGFSFSIPSNWRTFGEVGQSLLPNAAAPVAKLYGIANNIGNSFGFADIGAAYASRKIYQKSGYMTIKIPLMVVDWTGVGQPILSAMLMSYYSLPSKTLNIKKELKEIEQWVENELEKARQSDNLLVSTGANIVGATKNFTEGVVNLANQKVEAVLDKIPNVKPEGRAKSELEDLDDLYTLRSSPVPIKVEIGEYFKNDDMIIENIDFAFSKEMTSKGPLFVKIDLSLSTRKILTSPEDIGLRLKGRGFRFLSVTGDVDEIGSTLT